MRTVRIQKDGMFCIECKGSDGGHVVLYEDRKMVSDLVLCKRCYGELCGIEFDKFGHCKRAAFKTGEKIRRRRYKRPR